MLTITVQDSRARQIQNLLGYFYVTHKDGGADVEGALCLLKSAAGHTGQTWSDNMWEGGMLCEERRELW